MLKKLTAILSAAIVSCCCIVDLSMIPAQAANQETQSAASDSPTIGDVDANGRVNALDASLILSVSAALGSSSNTTFTEELLYSADANGDGQINALDSTVILAYSSYAGTGGTDDFATYLEQLDKSDAEATDPPAQTDPSGLTGHIVSLTEEEATMLAALVTLEAGTENSECQKAVASLVINRMLTSNTSLEQVIYAKNQFSVAGKVASTTPSASSVEAVNEVLTTGTTLPIYVTFFRTRYYHSWGDQVGYCCIGSTYFSYSQALKNKYV